MRSFINFQNFESLFHDPNVKVFTICRNKFPSIIKSLMSVSLVVVSLMDVALVGVAPMGLAPMGVALIPISFCTSPSNEVETAHNYGICRN